MKALLILPTYNERENIVEMLATVRSLHSQLDILVIDDNSPDGTGALVKERQRSDKHLHIIERPGKLGLGSAYIQGIQYALADGYDAVISMDCDFSHPPEKLATMLSLLNTHDMVIGSRYVPGGSIPQWTWLRRLVSKVGNNFTRAVIGCPMHDLTGGFNGFSKAGLQRLQHENIRSSGYDFQLEIKLRGWRAGLAFAEFPIVFIDRQHGKSKIPKTYLLRAFFKVLKWRLFGF